ncbi:MAG: hypothetical protein HC859_13595 [Bacteroidia bacterium]|nr:hypothetical protein [Bacteroidia bacterium]
MVIKNTRAGKAVVRINFEDESEEVLMEATDENIGSPQLMEKYLLFSSPHSGIDNIYAVDLDTKQRYQVTTSKYGAYNPAVSPDGRQLYYNEQTRDGMDVAHIPFNPQQWKPHNAPVKTSSLVRTLVAQEGNRNLVENVPDQAYPVSRYFKAGGIINPFAWGPYAATDLNTYSIGITSRDILSTTQIDLGYQFDYAEQTGRWRAHASYQGWAPIIDFTYTQGERTVDEGDYNIRVVEGTDTTDMVRNVTVDWKEKNIEAGLRIPLVTTQSKYNGAFTFSDYIGYTHAYEYENGVGNGRFVPAFVRNDTIVSVYPLFTYVGNNNLLYNHFTLSAYRLLKVAPRDIQSRWGQAVTLNYYKTMGKSDLYGGVVSLWTRLYFPGVMKNHSLYGHWAYQKNFVNADFSDYHFRNTIPIPRGQSVNRFEEFYSMSANYALPLWYPDIALGPLLNIQRVRLNAFVDYAFGSSRMYDGSSVAYSSMGGELTFDINVLRFLPQLDITFRLARGIDPARTTFDVILGTINF